MTGIDCPVCGEPTDYGSTTNEWAYVCTPCDARFNRDGVRMPPFDTIIRFYRNGTDVVPHVPDDTGWGAESLLRPLRTRG